MLNFLYLLLLYPVYLFVEFVFFTANILTGNDIGLSIVVLSIIINIICLPIYNVAERFQENERRIQQKLKTKVKDIKSVFSGDERYMILSTYYRQNNYQPIFALRAMFPLLIQIPFFIAAYSLLSDLPVLNEVNFMFLKDLSKPDALFQVGNISVNILPIIMTIVNLFASAVYTKGLELKEKLQLYGTAFVFLVLLYDSASGLVLYWTLNNLFSLIKNIFYKIKLSKQIWYFVSVAVLLILTGSVMLFAESKVSVLIMICLTGGLLLVPVVKKTRHFTYMNGRAILDDGKKRFLIFLLSLLALMIFIGLVIPSATIASSPVEFSNIEGIQSPFDILFYTITQSLGCGLWLTALYLLFGKQTQKYFAYFAVIVLFFALVNAYVFTGDYGNISKTLVFDDITRLLDSYKLFFTNIFVLLMGGGGITFIICSRKFSKFIPIILGITMSAFIVLTLISSGSIYSNMSRNKDAIAAANEVNAKKKKAYKVSKTGKNIFIIMLDRSMNFFIDPIFKNCAAVKKEYTGFTVFENTIAFALSTNFSTPSLFGGYEYTPENINKRSSELLVNKHNEALSVLPKLFSENGWNVSFTDPPWLNYCWNPDLSVFKQYTMTVRNIDFGGKYTDSFLAKLPEVQNIEATSYISGIRRKMLLFSIFRTLPYKVRRVFYAQGKYARIDLHPDLPYDFFNAYAALENMHNEIEFVSDENCINIIVNNITHEPIKDEVIKFTGRDDLIPLAKDYCLNQYTAEHFYVNYLAHESCARFFKFLKDNNCWDNSRIIIAGDHGRDPIHTIDMNFLKKFNGSGLNPERLIPLLMMKDFNSEGALKKDSMFMTLADIPILTTEGLPQELQKNPFSGIPFKAAQDKRVVKAVYFGDWQADKQIKLTQFKIKDWVFIKDDVYNPECWSRNDFTNK